MLNVDRQFNDCSDNCVQFVHLVKKAAEAVNIVVTAKRKSLNAVSVMNSCDKLLMWNVLQAYIAEYADFIQETSKFTGLCLIKVDYAYVSIESIRRQLEIIIGVIYMKEALKSVSKKAFIECLKKLVKESRLLNKYQLKYLLQI